MVGKFKVFIAKFIYINSFFLTAIAATAGVALSSGIALAEEEVHTLRIQTHYAPETVSGKLAAQFVDDIETMSNGRLKVEMFYSSSVVKSVETFDAAATGILDADMTGGAYQTGKNPAFQFVGDIMGGYDTPWQQYAWLYNGGFDAADQLYNKYGMKLIGWWIYGQESLSSNELKHSARRAASSIVISKSRTLPSVCLLVIFNDSRIDSSALMLLCYKFFQQRLFDKPFFGLSLLFTCDCVFIITIDSYFESFHTKPVIQSE